MHINNNPYISINRSSQDFQTASASSSSPPAERAKTAVERQATTRRASASSLQLALLAKIHEHAYEVEFLSGLQTIHNQNVDKVHEQVDAFIETFVAKNPEALSTEIRDGISSNLEQILKDAQLDISCYQKLGDMKAEDGKHLIFSSLGVSLLKDAPLCFQLFHSKSGQNPAEAPSQPGLVECASYVVDDTITERLDDGKNQPAEETNKEPSDAGNLRVIDNPEENLPHSLKNPEDNPVTTVHAYPMDGISDDKTVAVQSEFAGFKNPKSAVYSAYDTFVGKVKTGGADRTPIPEIGANNLLEDLKANKFGTNPVIVDIRESNEVQRSGALHIEGASILHVPRGVAIAKILADFPDRNTHLVLTCRGGARSVLLAADLRALGYNSTVVSDGAMGCAKQGLMKAYDADPKTADKWNEELDMAPPALTEHIQQLKSSIVAMTAEELASGLKEKNLVVFDVRQENERSSGVIPNTQWVPAGEFEKKARFHAHDLSTPIAIYSADDGDYRALIAVRNLMEMGYPNVKYLEGGYNNYIDQDVPADSPSSEIRLGTKEIQKEQESPLLSSAASLNHDVDQDLDVSSLEGSYKNHIDRGIPAVSSSSDLSLGTQEIQEEQVSPLLSSAHDSEEDLEIRDGAKPIMLGDLPKSREVLFNSTNLAARMLGAALEDIQTRFKKGHVTPMEHVEQCDQIFKAAEMLTGKGKIKDDVLRSLNLDKMTPQTNLLTKKEYLSITDDLDVQLDAEHGVAAVLERNKQSARAADRARRTLMNKTRATTAKVLYHALDAAASSLSYSAAAVSNSSLYKRSMASGAAWTASAAFNSISRLLSPQDRNVVGVLSDFADIGAGIASMAATGISHQSNPNQNDVNNAATGSNGLWMISGMLSSVSAIQNGRKLASTHGMSTLAYTATGFGIAEDWANIAAAGVGIASTKTSDGSNVTLNKLSAGLWMAGTVFGSIGTAFKVVDERLQKNEANRPREIELSSV